MCTMIRACVPYASLLKSVSLGPMGLLLENIKKQMIPCTPSPQKMQKEFQCSKDAVVLDWENNYFRKAIIGCGGLG